MGILVNMFIKHTLANIMFATGHRSAYMITIAGVNVVYISQFDLFVFTYTYSIDYISFVKYMGSYNFLFKKKLSLIIDN